MCNQLILTNYNLKFNKSRKSKKNTIGMLPKAFIQLYEERDMD